MATGDYIMHWEPSECIFHNSDPWELGQRTIDSCDHDVLVGASGGTEKGDFAGRFPVALPTGGIDFEISYTMATGTANAVKVEGAVMNQTDEIDLDTATYGSTQVSADDTVPGTAGALGQMTISFTTGQVDSVAEGDDFSFRLIQDAPTSRAAGDLYIHRIVMVEG